MEKLVRVMGLRLWNEQPSDTWESTFLVDENGWAEGVIKATPTDEEKLIFGIYHSAKVLELISSDGEYCSFYTGKFDNGYYKGSCGPKIGEFQLRQGKSQILTDEINLTSNLDHAVEEEVAALESKLPALRTNYINQELYSKWSNDRRLISIKAIKRLLLGEDFEQEEVEEISTALKEKGLPISVDTIGVLARRPQAPMTHPLGPDDGE